MAVNCVSYTSSCYTCYTVRVQRVNTPISHSYKWTVQTQAVGIPSPNSLLRTRRRSFILLVHNNNVFGKEVDLPESVHGFQPVTRIFSIQHRRQCWRKLAEVLTVVAPQPDVGNIACIADLLWGAPCDLSSVKYRNLKREMFCLVTWQLRLKWINQPRIQCQS